MSQSPSYRVTLSDSGGGNSPCRAGWVSIPFLSGHSFRPSGGACNSGRIHGLNPLPIGSLFPTELERPGVLYRLESQSPSYRVTLSDQESGFMIEQGVWSQSPSYRVTLSDENSHSRTAPFGEGLNPLPIGSLFPTERRRKKRINARSLNPLPIGSLFPTEQAEREAKRTRQSQSPSYRVTLSDVVWTHSAEVALGCLNPLPIGSLFPTGQQPYELAAVDLSQSPSYRVTLSD